MSGADKRRHRRYTVRLQVRFGKALEFVTEYAENLSAGGLFVRGGHRLQPMTEVEVEVVLPGFDRFRLRGRVAHIVSPELALLTGRAPGAGLEIVREPEDFADALREYLRRLGRRRDVALLVAPGAKADMFVDAGFHTAPLPAPERLVEAVKASARPVLAVLVPRAIEWSYREAANRAGVGGLVRPLDHEEELDELLTAIDAIL